MPMMILVNLRGVAFLAAGCAAWIGLLALGVAGLTAALAGCAVAIGIDLATRLRRPGRPLMHHEAGGMIGLVPVWMVGLLAALTATLIATALPDDWDHPRSRPDVASPR
ncbi:MAG: hypothetical protein IPL61_24270 [Myxococcales bacterium]|nr:hypothetical protein [Myxococcales bacterium]